MKRTKFYLLLLLATVMVFGCSKYDDTELKNDVSDLQSRVTKLEEWCATTNSQITALQGLIDALEKNDYVKGVTPVMDGTKEVGYTITFAKNSPVTIMHGKDGTNGTNGITPIIGVAKDTDGIYYWTVKMGEAEATWVLDADGQKIRPTGTEGTSTQSPKLSVEKVGDRYYWKVNGEWLMAGGQKVPATGEKGEQGNKGDKGDTGAAGSSGSSGSSIITAVTPNTEGGYVVFKLAGDKEITLPLLSTAISFEGYTPLQIATTATATDVIVKLPTTLKKADFAAIKADITNIAGTSSAITRSASEKWTVELTAPTFPNGAIKDQPKLTVKVPATAVDGETALLKVTVVDTKGNESTSTRVLFFSNKVASTGVTLDKVGPLTIKVGATEALIATVAPAGASQIVTWTTSDATVATVAAGVVTAVKAGSATITATTTEGGFTATCAVTVENIAVTGITLADATVSLGDKKTLTATIVPAGATIKTVTWSSSTTGVATINATTGEVTAVAVGETTITATSTSNPTVTATCKVKVEDKPSITWAVGNLVADGANGAKIGTATDKGLYFQFGSLIGWSTTGNPAIAVSPAGYTGSTTWSSSWTGDPATENAVTGTGDPCKYYLKGTWRLPTKGEYEALFENHGYPSTGPWIWAKSSATNSTKNLTFPASGCRANTDPLTGTDPDGSLSGVGQFAYYWSASPKDADNGYILTFFSDGVYPSQPSKRTSGLSVRCVQEASN